LPVPHPLLLWLLSGFGPSIITAFSVGTAPPLPTKIAPDGGPVVFRSPLDATLRKRQVRDLASDRRVSR